MKKNTIYTSKASQSAQPLKLHCVKRFHVRQLRAELALPMQPVDYIVLNGLT